MRKTRAAIRFPTATLFLVLAAGLPGCATTEFAPPAPEVRAQLGAVTVVPVSARASRAVDDPVKGAGRGALSGAGQGAASGFLVGASFCQTPDPLACAFGLVLGTALAVPGAVVGSIAGASLAHPAEEVEAATASLVAAMADARPHEDVARQIAEAKHLPHDLRAMDAGAYVAGDYSQLAEDGRDSVLEIEAVLLELYVAGDIDPDISPKLTVQGRLVRAGDDVELYSRTWLYWGQERDYFEAAADDARLLRQDLQDGYEALAARIANDLFRSTLPERHREPKEGRIVTLQAPVVDKDAPKQETAEAPGDVAVPAETAALYAPGDAEGRWVARKAPWQVELRISDERVHLEAECDSSHPIVATAWGTIDETGQIYAILTPGTWDRTVASGTLEHLDMRTRHSDCRGTALQFQRAG
jgi:hypothetical protein